MAATAQETFSGTREVSERDRFDEAALARWMADHVEGFEGPLTVRQFKGGQSNPTYELSTPGRAYVLRRKPFGKLLPSAHAVDREYRLIAALHPTGFPVARPYALCEDEAVIGAMFYVMERVDGRILWNLALPDQSREARAAIYDAQIATLAQLHGFDPAAVGLGDYGRPGNYFARQVDRWSRQIRASGGEPIPALERLMDWLPRTVPEDDRTSIVHGDYRLDNMVLHPAEPRILAVLDWELSTLGNPLADFSYYLMQWAMPVSDGRGIAGLDLEALGIPSMEAVVARYCALTGRAGLPDLDWYFSYNLFRLAGIVAGIGGRVRDGTAASPQAAAMAARAPMLAEAAWSFAERAGA
ncbi:MAG: phosphotransferase family protein [Caulobacteraceae bacterium]|nr:phosphotransferase family protein [Caulobacter sp.]